MSCRIIFTDKFVQSVLPKAFINGDLHHHRQSIFMMQERERLKMYEYLVPKYKRRQKDALRIKKLSSDIHKLEYKIKQNKSTDKLKDKASIAKLREEKETIINNGFRLSDESNTAKITKIREALGPKCPVEGCKGHTVANEGNYRCQICEANICKKCLLKIINDEHKCNASDVKSLEFILQDSKPCPGCGMMIFRESGCPAMFCIYCTTSFNWYSLEIEAPSHNPHYYEWLQKKKYVETPFYSNEDLLAADQNNIPEYDILNASMTNYHDGSYDFALECHRLASEMKDLIPMTIHDESEIELLRVKYLVGEISETKFMDRIMVLQKEADYYNHQRESISTAHELLKTELWRLTFKEYTMTDFTKNSFNILNAYAKDQIEIADKYNKKYTQTRNTYAGLKITYIIMEDFEKIMIQRENQNRQDTTPIPDDWGGYWSDY
ncbi:Hypothetical protein HVR_LOCUS662 [uncultured virus]|nr:Hypothetical protein HVR_LOCUS662 [uncultured virus]